MPRPSLQTQRRAQILDAFEICVAQYGLHGATLERVAEEAGMARTLLRHNIGNREDLIAALVERYFEQSDSAVELLIGGLPAEGPADVLLDRLFDRRSSDRQLMLVASALISASAGDPELAERMRDWSVRFQGRLEAVLANAYPEASCADVSAAAAGLMGIYFNVESLGPLGNMTQMRAQSRRAAEMLLTALA